MIILSLITSAKSVKLVFTPSYSAHFIASVVLLILIWAAIVVPIPLVASVWFCGRLIARPISDFLPEKLQGEVDINFDGYLQLKKRQVFFESVSVLHSFAFISFQL